MWREEEKFHDAENLFAAAAGRLEEIRQQAVEAYPSGTSASSPQLECVRPAFRYR
jgi:hypothetical protein